MTVKRNSIVRLRRNPDGSYVRLLRGGKTRPYAVREPDHATLDRLTDAELTARARSDPDNPPVDEATLRRMAIAGRVKAVRIRSRLSQSEFAARFGIPIGTLRDWEYGRRIPDAAAMTLLKVIDQEPKAVVRAVIGRAQSARA